MYGSAAHEKRQTEVYRSIMTLDDLTSQLNKDGFNVKRSAVYLRLQPKKYLLQKHNLKVLKRRLQKAQTLSHIVKQNYKLHIEFNVT